MHEKSSDHFFKKMEKILTQGDYIPNILLSNLMAEVSVRRKLMHTLLVRKSSCHMNIFHRFL